MPNLFPLTLNHLHDSAVIKSLGKGGFGDVKLYQCKEKEISATGDVIECCRCFVVKRSKRASSYFWNLFKSSKHLKKMECNLKRTLLNEYSIGILLHHPNVRETVDIDLVDNCIIFEYCNGCDFHDFILQNSRNQGEFLFYFKQIIDAVEYIHGKDIAHRDLKLENIMIDCSTRVLKLIDFGEACVCNRDGMKINSNGVHGTLPYIAPEEFLNVEYDALKVDIWAIGIILYEILYCRIPWTVANSTDTRFVDYMDAFETESFLNGNYFQLKEEEEVLRKLFTMTLCPNPELRSDISEVKMELERVDIHRYY